MFKSIQKIFFLFILIVSLPKVSFSQHDVLNSHKNANRNNIKMPEPYVKKNDKNVVLLMNKLKSSLHDVNALDKSDFSVLESSFNHYLKVNELNFIVPSFKVLIDMNQSTIESICNKYGKEMKDICIQIKNNLNTLK